MRLLSGSFRWGFLFAVVTACTAPHSAAAESAAAAAFLEKLSLSPASAPVLTLCHGFGCAFRNEFVVTPARLAFVRLTLSGVRHHHHRRRAQQGLSPGENSHHAGLQMA
jgi:hypothetical protein